MQFRARSSFTLPTRVFTDRHRPMYGNHNGLLVMAGDRPFARYGAGESVHGQLTLGYHRSTTNTTVWFHTLETGYTAQYRGGQVRWNVHPVPGTTAVVTWTVLPLDNGIGMVSEITTTGASTGAYVWNGQ